MKKENKKTHPILKGILKFFLILIILVVLFIGGFIGYSTFKNGWGIKGIIKTAVGSEVKTPEELGEFRTLILGVSEDISTPLTDTIMIASYNPSTQKATLADGVGKCREARKLRCHFTQCRCSWCRCRHRMRPPDRPLQPQLNPQLYRCYI